MPPLQVDETAAMLKEAAANSEAAAKAAAAAEAEASAAEAARAQAENAASNNYRCASTLPPVARCCVPFPDACFRDHAKIADTWKRNAGR